MAVKFQKLDFIRLIADIGIRAVRTSGQVGGTVVHMEVDAALSAEAGHDIAVDARRRAMQRHRVLKVTTHADP